MVSQLEPTITMICYTVVPKFSTLAQRDKATHRLELAGTNGTVELVA